MIERSEAVVLKSQNWAESSRIVHVFSKRHGLLKLLAKGARRPRSKFGGCLEPAHYIQIIFYPSRVSDLHNLSEAAILWRPRSSDHSLKKTRLLAAGLEIPLRAAAPETPTLSLFLNLYRFVRGIDNLPEERHLNCLLDFSLRALGNLGYHPILKTCVSCQRALDHGAAGFSMELGGLICDACARRHRQLAGLSPVQARYLINWDLAQRPRIFPSEAVSLIKILLTFLNHHLSEKGRLRCFHLI